MEDVKGVSAQRKKVLHQALMFLAKDENEEVREKLVDEADMFGRTVVMMVMAKKGEGREALLESLVSKHGYLPPSPKDFVRVDAAISASKLDYSKKAKLLLSSKLALSYLDTHQENLWGFYVQYLYSEYVQPPEKSLKESIIKELSDETARASEDDFIKMILYSVRTDENFAQTVRLMLEEISAPPSRQFVVLPSTEKDDVKKVLKKRVSWKDEQKRGLNPYVKLKGGLSQIKAVAIPVEPSQDEPASSDASPILDVSSLSSEEDGVSSEHQSVSSFASFS